MFSDVSLYHRCMFMGHPLVAVEKAKFDGPITATWFKGMLMVSVK
jgi:hypothetical protein